MIRSKGFAIERAVDFISILQCGGLCVCVCVCVCVCFVGLYHYNTHFQYRSQKREMWIVTISHIDCFYLCGANFG